MNKKILILISFIFCFSIVLTGCNNNSDTTQIDEQVSSFIKNMGEDSISLDEEQQVSFLVSEEESTSEETNQTEEALEVEYADPHDDPELLLPDEKLPQIQGYYFDIPSMAEMQSFNTDPFEYLGVTWIPSAVPAPKQSFGKNCSLYLTSLMVYDDKSPSQFNEDYLELLTNTINYFGEPIYEYNTDIVDLKDISTKGPISLMFKTSEYYLIALIEDSVEDESIVIDYYFLSTEVPHSENNEYSLIDFVRQHDSNFKIQVYYETEEGSFVL